MDPNVAWRDFLWDLVKCEELIEARRDDIPSDDLEQLDCELFGYHEDALNALQGLDAWIARGGFPPNFDRILRDSYCDAASSLEAIDRFSFVSDIVGMLEGSPLG